MPSAISTVPDQSGQGTPLESSLLPASHRVRGVAIDLDPRSLTRMFVAVIALLVLLHGITQTLRFAVFDGGNMGGLVPLFSLGSDGNLPTYFSSLVLFFSGLMLLALAVAELRNREHDGWYWVGLSLVFAFLAIDEMLQLHERLTEPMRTVLGTGGLLFYAWIVPYGLGTLVLVTIYWRFLWRLPRDTAWLMLLSGAIFVGGAIGVEMLGGLVFERIGSINPVYVGLQTIEEVLEMSGIVLFLYAISSHFVRRHGSLSLLLAKPAGPQPPEP